MYFFLLISFQNSHCQTLFLKTLGTVFIQMNYLRKAIYIFFALNSCIFSVSSYIFYSRFVLFRNIKIFLHFSFLSFLCFGLLFSLPSPPTGSLRLPLFSLPSTYTACLDRGVELASFSNLREERYRYSDRYIYIHRKMGRQIDRQIYRQIDRQIDTQIYR